MSIPELINFILTGEPEYPAFRIYEGGRVSGYCFPARFKKRQAYDRTAGISVCLGTGYTGRGIGTAALTMPEDAAKTSGIRVITGILLRRKPCAYPPDGNVRLHAVRTPENAGKKSGKIPDVVMYGKEP